MSMLSTVEHASPAVILTIVMMSAGVGTLISSLEWIARRADFREDGLFSWTVVNVESPARESVLLDRLLGMCFRYPNVLLLLGLRAAFAATMLMAAPSRVWFAVLALAVAGLSILLTMRGPHGFTGADQMMKMTLFAGSICLLVPSPWLWQAALVFVAGQLVLAYGTSGWIRVFEPTWRDGSALMTVLRQHTYGNRHAWRALRARPALARGASLAVLAFECTFVVALLGWSEVTIAYLVVGAAFHLANAVILGLNTFTWAFVGAYPAVLWLSLKIGW